MVGEIWGRLQRPASQNNEAVPREDTPNQTSKKRDCRIKPNQQETRLLCHGKTHRTIPKVGAETRQSVIKLTLHQC